MTESCRPNGPVGMGGDLLVGRRGNGSKPEKRDNPRPTGPSQTPKVEREMEKGVERSEDRSS